MAAPKVTSTICLILPFVMLMCLTVQCAPTGGLINWLRNKTSSPFANSTNSSTTVAPVSAQFRRLCVSDAECEAIEPELFCVFNVDLDYKICACKDGYINNGRVCLSKETRTFSSHSLFLFVMTPVIFFMFVLSITVCINKCHYDYEEREAEEKQERVY